MDVTDSPEQVRELLKRSLEKHIKGGWRKVSSLTDRQDKQQGQNPTKGTTRKREKVEA